MAGSRSLFDDRTESASQFVLGLIPLLLGDHHTEIGMGEQLSSPRAEQFGDERTRVRDDDHSAWEPGCATAQRAPARLNALPAEVVGGKADRPLDAAYPVIFVSGVNVKIRDGNVASGRRTRRPSSKASRAAS